MRYSRSLLFPKEGFLFPGIRSGGLATSGRRKIFPYRAAQAEPLRPHSHSRPGKVRKCVGRNRPTRSVLPEIPGGITSRRIYRNVCFGKISQSLRRIRSGQGRVRRARTPRGNRSADESTTPHRSVFPVLRCPKPLRSEQSRELLPDGRRKENPECRAHGQQQQVHHPQVGFRIAAEIDVDILLEKEVERRNQRSGEEQVLGNAEKVDLRKPHQRPDEIYGFPSKVDDDPVLNLVVSNDTSYNYAEERRLFYVALTRTKNRVFIVTPEKRPSEFIKELLSDPKSYPNVTLQGELKTDLAISNVVKDRCPICGYPMQFRWNKNYGLRLWICTNDQEICGFMTNDKRGGELSIQKCDWCKDGYLIVKGGRSGPILGCTNYKSDKSGCGRLLSQEHYRAWRKDDFGVEDLSKDKPAYFRIPESSTANPQAPEMIPVKTNTTRKSAAVHTIGHSERMIEKDGFKVIVDTNGSLLTDMDLLVRLKALRQTLAQEENLPAYCVLTNDVLSRLATDKPTTREEFVEIKGIGEQRYKRFGERFIAEIKKHIES